MVFESNVAAVPHAWHVAYLQHFDRHLHRSWEMHRRINGGRGSRRSRWPLLHVVQVTLALPLLLLLHLFTHEQLAHAYAGHHGRGAWGPSSCRTVQPERWCDSCRWRWRTDRSEDVKWKEKTNKLRLCSTLHYYIMQYVELNKNQLLLRLLDLDASQ